MREVDVGRSQRGETAQRIAHGRSVKVAAVVLSKQAAFGQYGMFGEMSMNLRDRCDGGADEVRVRNGRIRKESGIEFGFRSPRIGTGQPAIAQILVDVPDAAPTALGSNS